MNKMLTAAAALLATTSAGFAFGVPTAAATPVPEISALEGTAALAAVAAIVLLAWERRRRAS